MTKKIYSIEWDDDLGPEWLNKYNLELLCFSAQKIDSDLIVIKDITEMTYCAYCGAEFPVDDDAGQVGKHIMTCDKHPIALLREALEVAKNALRSYQYGNQSTELAEEVANHIEALATTAKEGGE